MSARPLRFNYFYKPQHLPSSRSLKTFKVVAAWKAFNLSIQKNIHIQAPSLTLSVPQWDGHSYSPSYLRVFATNIYLWEGESLFFLVTTSMYVLMEGWRFTN